MFWTALKRNWLVWTPFQLVNLTYGGTCALHGVHWADRCWRSLSLGVHVCSRAVPLELRPVFGSFVAMLWTIYLALLSRRKESAKKGGVDDDDASGAKH